MAAHSLRSLSVLSSFVLSVGSICGSARAQTHLARGCEFQGGITGSLAPGVGGVNFLSVTDEVPVRVQVSPGVGSASNVTVTLDAGGWSLRGVFANAPLTVYLIRPGLMEGLYLPTTSEPLRLVSTSHGKATVAVELPVEYGSPRTLEHSFTCGQLSLAPNWDEPNRFSPPLGTPLARTTLRPGLERVELSATPNGASTASIDVSNFTSDTLEVYRRKGGWTRVRLGQLIGWVRDELLETVEPLEFDDTYASGDPNAPTAPWGTSLQRGEAVTTLVDVPGSYTCATDVPVYSELGTQFVPVGKVTAGTTFTHAGERERFRAVAPLLTGATAHSLWAATSDLAACRHSGPRRLEFGTTTLPPRGLSEVEHTAAAPVGVGRHRDILDLARGYEAHADYGLARDAYDAYSQLHGVPNVQAHSASLRSVYLSIVLGELELARTLLVRVSAALQNDARYTELALRLADAMLHEGQADTALMTVDKALLEVNTGDARRPARARFHGLRARAFEALGRTEEASAEWDAVLLISEASLVNINAGASDEELALLADLGGEALFRRATRLHTEADRTRVPVYSGARTRNEILRFIYDRLGPWVETKRKQLQAASDAYERVLHVWPAPPPRWVIAASVRVGQLWGDFVADYRSVPLPDDVEPDSPHRASSYFGTFDSPDAPFLQRAKGAYLTALEFGHRYGIANADTRAAEVWLANNYRAEFRLLDEFVPQATSTGTERLQPVPLD